MCVYLPESRVDTAYDHIREESYLECILFPCHRWLGLQFSSPVVRSYGEEIPVVHNSYSSPHLVSSTRMPPIHPIYEIFFSSVVTEEFHIY